MTEYAHGFWERSWTLLGNKYRNHLYLVHVRHVYREPGRSGPTPRHIWRLQYGQTSLTLKYGVATEPEPASTAAEEPTDA